MILQAAWVVPITAPPIRAGYVEIRDTRIQALGPQHALPAGAHAEDLGNAILVPGLVNPHTHLHSGSGSPAWCACGVSPGASSGSGPVCARGLGNRCGPV